jgi:hypothetical protein
MYDVKFHTAEVTTMGPTVPSQSVPVSTRKSPGDANECPVVCVLEGDAEASQPPTHRPIAMVRRAEVATPSPLAGRSDCIEERL